MIQTATAVYLNRAEWAEMQAARQAVHDGVPGADFHQWKLSKGIAIRGTKNFFCLDDMSPADRAAVGV